MRVLVEADGGSRGNPGPAGCGAVVKAADGTVLAERAEGIGEATNNVAEYRGLLAGLRAAADLGATEVEVRMDSKLVVEQLSGRWKIKHPGLAPLAREAWDLAKAFTRVTYTWIPRAQNADADRLANKAMDAQAEGHPVAAAEDNGLFAEADLRAAPAVGGESAQNGTPASWTGATGTPTRLLLLRHGQTAMSAQRRYSGHGDPELTETGLAQAEAAAKRLATRTDISAVITSPLTRTRQTAQATADALGLRPVTHQGLIETDFGAWEGLTFQEAADRDPALHRRWLSDPTVPTPGGESFEQVHARVAKTRDDLLAEHGGSTIVVVSHVTPIKTLLRLALDAGPQLLFKLHLDLASLCVVEFYPDGNTSVRLVNDTSHLPGSA
ncbi:putative phosphoglycerate mutase [Crossiella equi]|uniref:Phosphoglycerate mutase n=1 Tax=Crossiella equi TaxID=130796 RepID=A0ABS5ABB7_9PSEU|nr:bifunctional RNase H/acid phosphatase [Crossiella equi]MBP2473888.1 putative phosphoglycerate mutase [Crossiella equi]